jgi:predicted PurR-regulated permease PerM
MRGEMLLHSSNKMIPYGTLALLWAAAGVLLYASYLIALPFAPALSWALALAIVFRPLFQFCCRKLVYRSTAALITVLLVGVGTVLPAVFLFYLLIEEFIASITLIETHLWTGTFDELIVAHPGLEPALNRIRTWADIPNALNSAASSVARWGSTVLRSFLETVLIFLITLYFLYFFLRDQSTVARFIQRALPLTPNEFDFIASRITGTVRAVIYGSLIVAVIQGGLGGITFWFLNLPAPLLWGVAMALLSLLPFVGAFVVWGPAAAYLAFKGEWGSAIFLTLFGTLVIGLIDNLLYPILVGRQLMMPTVVAFVAIIGGVLLVGAHGVVAGPVIVVAALSLVRILRDRHGKTTPGASDD